MTNPGDPKLLDPDCRDGKCGSCVGGPCQHWCHDDVNAPVTAMTNLDEHTRHDPVAERLARIGEDVRLSDSSAAARVRLGAATRDLHAFACAVLALVDDADRRSGDMADLVHVQDIRDAAARHLAVMSGSAPICGSCGRGRTLADTYDYNPLQVVTGQPLGWYSGDDGEVCPKCMTELLGGQQR